MELNELLIEIELDELLFYNGRRCTNLTCNNAEYICLYLAIHGTSRVADVKKALTTWRGVPSTHYSSYFSFDNININVDRESKPHTCFLSPIGIRRALSASKRTGVEVNVDVTLDQAWRCFGKIGAPPMELAAIKSMVDTNPATILNKLLTWLLSHQGENPL